MFRGFIRFFLFIYLKSSTKHKKKKNVSMFSMLVCFGKKAHSGIRKNQQQGEQITYNKDMCHNQESGLLNVFTSTHSTHTPAHLPRDFYCPIVITFRLMRFFAGNIIMIFFHIKLQMCCCM